MKNKMQNKNGITLIALVITIIILLILASVSIAMLTGENGIITKASNTAKQTSQANALEKIEVAVSGSWDEKGKLNLDELINNLKNVEGQTNIGNAFPLKVTVDNYNYEVSTSGVVLKITGGEWTGIINSPKLTEDMTPIYWDDNGNEIQTTSQDSNWYDYEINKWANAKTQDGSYWVWIPRYAYKITSGLYTSDAGNIEIKFIDNNNSDGSRSYDTKYPSVTKDAMDDYVVHPAFTDGTNNNYENGQWDCNIPGIWVAKYEMGMETNGVATETVDEIVGNVLASADTKVVSKPGITSWRYISVGNSYTNSYNYDRKKESHQMKSSQWGAVIYLTQSKYGKNGNEVSRNDNQSYYTGGGEGESYKTNILQSTTGNITGIYDLNGGAWERLTTYVADGDERLQENGSSFAMSTSSTKYATIYPHDENKDSASNNYIKYKQDKEIRFGDAILETSTQGNESTSWMANYSRFPKIKHPYLVRGGFCNSGAEGGIFAFNFSNGDFQNSYGFGFRVCLAF